MHFLILVISDSAMLPFSATGGGRKTTLMKGGVCVEYIAVIVIFTFFIVFTIKKYPPCVAAQDGC